jgi:hypothetical protein
MRTALGNDRSRSPYALVTVRGMHLGGIANWRRGRGLDGVPFGGAALGVAVMYLTALLVAA